MKTSIPTFAKNTISILSLFGLAISGTGVICSILQIFLSGSANWNMFLISICVLPVFGFIFMRVEHGMSMKIFLGKYILLPLGVVLFLGIILYTIVDIHSIIEKTSAINIFLFCFSLFSVCVCLSNKNLIERVEKNFNEEIQIMQNNVEYYGSEIKRLNDTVFYLKQLHQPVDELDDKFDYDPKREAMKKLFY